MRSCRGRCVPPSPRPPTPPAGRGRSCMRRPSAHTGHSRRGTRWACTTCRRGWPTPARGWPRSRRRCPARIRARPRSAPTPPAASATSAATCTAAWSRRSTRGPGRRGPARRGWRGWPMPWRGPAPPTRTPTTPPGPASRTARGVVTDVLDRLAGPAGELLARVDDILVARGLPAGHPIVDLLRRLGALPADAAHAISAQRSAPLRAAGSELRRHADGYGALHADNDWRGTAAERFAAQRSAAAAHLAGSAERIRDTADYLDDVADWIDRS